LIYGAGGGVGTYAVQLAKYFGVEVTAVCSSKNAELARSIGADHIIDNTKADFTRIGKHFDLILAVNGRQALSTYKRALTSTGICVMVGGDLSQVLKSMVFGALMSGCSQKMRYLAAQPNVEDAEFVIKLVEEGKIKPVIERRYSLHETPEAMSYLSQGHARGKVIIAVALA
jgi:NADPH:quinone reductase-like Zn-dependent oxidoreductase